MTGWRGREGRQQRAAQRLKGAINALGLWGFMQQKRLPEREAFFVGAILYQGCGGLRIAAALSLVSDRNFARITLIA